MSSPESSKPKIDVDLTILDLSDDCLIPIFNNLNPLDLVSVYDCCEYFQPAAKYCFSKNYKAMKIFESKILFPMPLYRERLKNMVPPFNEVSDREGYGRYNFKFVLKYRMYNKENVEYTSLLKILCCFGKYVKEINFKYFEKIAKEFEGHPQEIKCKSNFYHILKVANDYCGEELKSFSLSSLHFVDVAKIDEFGNLFKRLEKFSTESVRSAIIEKCLDHCENLKELVINRSQVQLPMILKTFDRLEKFDCIERSFPLDIRPLSMFLRNHPNLKYVNIRNWLLGTPDYLNFLQNVETLELGLQRQDRPSLSKFDWVKLLQIPKLKSITIYITVNVSESFAKIQNTPQSSIECIDLKTSRFKYIADLLSVFTFNNLKVLKICPIALEKTYFISNVDINIFQSFVEALKNVEELHFNGLSDNFNTFLLQFVRLIPHLKIVVLSTRERNHDFVIMNILDLANLKQVKNTLLTIRSKYRLNEVIEYANKTGQSVSNLKFLKFEYLEQNSG